MIKNKLKVRACKHCNERFMQERPGQEVHLECISGYVETLRAKRLKRERKVERVKDKARAAEIETIPELIKKTQPVFNLFVRMRDAQQPCISCGKPPPNLEKLHAGRDAGHYRSTGAASHLRFNEDNCHAQCVDCNQWGAGMAVEYRIRLIQRIGLARVEALEGSNLPNKWTKDELRAIKATYAAKVKALK